jgi:HEAT repeat protein
MTIVVNLINIFLFIPKIESGRFYKPRSSYENFLKNRPMAAYLNYFYAAVCKRGESMKRIAAALLFSIILPLALRGETNITPPQPTALEIWQQTMEFGVTDQRKSAINAIEIGKAKEAYFIIENALLNDPNDSIRKEAGYAMLRLGISNQTVWMNALNKETKPAVLQTIVFGISELKITAAGPKLYELLTNYLPNMKESYLTAGILRAIGEIKYQKANTLVYSILTNYTYPEEVRGSAAIAIGNIGTKEQIAQLVVLVNNPGEVKSVRMYAAYAMGKSGDPAMIDILVPIIEDEKNDINIRAYAIAGLAFINSPIIIDKMMKLATVDTVRIRIEAIKALGKLKATKAKELLIYKVKYDPDGTVKKEAKLALQAIGEDLVKLGLEKAPPAPAPTPAPGQPAPNKPAPSISVTPAPAVTQPATPVQPQPAPQDNPSPGNKTDYPVELDF